MREALFAMLGELHGASVLDLFAGTGALGIEALSRGAAHVVFVEHDDAALSILRENLSALAIDGAAASVRRSDARAALQSAREREEKYDLVFIDPPYKQAQALTDQLSAGLPRLLKDAARVVVESDRRSPLELELEVQRSRTYGDTLITIHRNP